MMSPLPPHIFLDSGIVMPNYLTVLLHRDDLYLKPANKQINLWSEKLKEMKNGIIAISFVHFFPQTIN